MKDVHYQRPVTVPEAVAELTRDGARALAGGTDLIPQLREHRRSASRLVDLKHIPKLIAVERQPDGGWHIGSAARISRLAAHRDFSTEHRALVDAACLIGSLQIQSRATLGGNIANAAPSADAVPLLIALDASAELVSAAGSRTVAVEDIPTEPGQTSLRSGELVAVIKLPARSRRSAARYWRFTPRREMDIAIAGSGVQIELAADGCIAAARVVLASVAPTPLRTPRAEAMLIGAMPSEALFAAAGAKAAEEARPISDTRGSAAYRRELVAVLTRRALADCALRLGAHLS